MLTPKDIMIKKQGKCCVLLIIDSLGIGGAEKSLLSLLSLLDSSKYQLCLWIRHRGGQLESFIPDHVEILPELSYTWIDKLLMKIGQTIYSIVYRLQRLTGIKRHLAETFWKCTGWAMKVPDGEYDVAVAYQQGIPTYLLTEKVKARRKIAWDNTNMVSAGYNMHFNEQFYAKLNYIVTVSHELQTLMQSYYPQFKEKIGSIYDILPPSLIRMQAYAYYPSLDKTTEDETILVTVGRLVPLKQYDLAIETAHLLHEKSFPFRWYIIGEGSERLHMERLIKEYRLERFVILTGMMTNPYPYMAQCDIYVQTSAFEGYGLTIAEAKILGKPVVSTNFDVVHDQLLHEHNGLIADMTAESVADNIIRLICDDTLRKKIIENVKAETNTTAETEIKKVERLLDED